MEAMPLFKIACKHGHAQMLEILIKSGVDINLTDQDGRTALMLASKKNHLGLVRFLVRNGADVNIKDKRGYSALTLAKKHNNKEIKDFLIKIPLVFDHRYKIRVFN